MTPKKKELKSNSALPSETREIETFTCEIDLEEYPFAGVPEGDMATFQLAPSPGPLRNLKCKKKKLQCVHWSNCWEIPSPLIKIQKKSLIAGKKTSQNHTVCHFLHTFF